MSQRVEVGVMGEFDPDLRYHRVTNEALDHAANALSITMKATWVSTLSWRPDTIEATLNMFDGIWCVPGDYESTDGTQCLHTCHQ